MCGHVMCLCVRVTGFTRDSNVTRPFHTHTFMLFYFLYLMVDAGNTHTDKRIH